MTFRNGAGQGHNRILCQKVISLIIFGSYYVNVSGMPMFFFKSYIYGKYGYRAFCPFPYFIIKYIWQKGRHLRSAFHAQKF